jgi:hypothetical protein
LAREYRDYRYFGDKIVTLDQDVVRRFKDERSIVLLRDVRTWMCKHAIANKVGRTDLDVVPAAIDFAAFVIATSSFERSLRIRMEDLIQQNDVELKRMSQFLGMELSPALDKWWERIGSWEADDPKSVMYWFDDSHGSSHVKPAKLDTTVELKPHAFWDAYLPLFDKYYLATDKIWSKEETEADLATLRKLRSFSPLPLTSCYANLETTRLKNAPKPVSPKPAEATAPEVATPLARRIVRRLKRLIK